MSSHRLPHLLVVVACAGALVGCSSAGGPTGSAAAPGVASLATATTPGAGPAQTAADPNDSRPLMRPDTSKAQVERLTQAFYQCLVDHGVPKTGTETEWKPVDDGTSPQYHAAGAACLSKNPESYTDRERRTDPGRWADHEHTWIGCMQQHGLHVERSDTRAKGWHWITDEYLLAESDSPWVDTCQRQAFGD